MAASMQYADDENIPLDENDKFKPSFKYFKQRKPGVDYSAVVDFENSQNENVFECMVLNHFEEQFCGLKKSAEWKVYGHKDFPGFWFIVNPFVPGAQKYWIDQCVREFPKKPNVRNLDVLSIGVDKDLWDDMLNVEDITDTDMYKLRWTTLGYHYEWNTKEYYEDRFTKVPVELCNMSRYVAQVLGFSDFKAESGVVNYYHLKSTLSPHADISEFDEAAPLVSFSFGPTAIYLLGGRTKETEPMPIYIKSGDIIIMSGEARFAYHAVPKIFPITLDKLNNSVFCDLNDVCCCGCDHVKSADNIKLDCLLCDVARKHSSFWKPYVNYMFMSRINMNVRQVLKPGQEFPARQET